jgi:hypothetical protein
MGCANPSQNHCSLIAAVATLLNNPILVQKQVRDNQLSSFVVNDSRFQLAQSNTLIPKSFWEDPRDCDVAAALLDVAEGAGLKDYMKITIFATTYCRKCRAPVSGVQYPAEGKADMYNLCVSLPPAKSPLESHSTLNLAHVAPDLFSVMERGIELSFGAAYQALETMLSELDECDCTRRAREYFEDTLKCEAIKAGISTPEELERLRLKLKDVKDSGHEEDYDDEALHIVKTAFLPQLLTIRIDRSSLADRREILLPTLLWSIGSGQTPTPRTRKQA